ncbi:hypothetical protein ABZ725_10620 [Streptomyces sp. NPDC006872]|uniref:hypothetical protein n=1 Tax=Streptomyces sp. NPDC006872 TaxID=3155720 RepID=UPI0033E790B7
MRIGIMGGTFDPPAVELFLIVGTDAAEGISQWYEAETIPRLARPIVCGRADHVPDPARLPRSGLYVPASPWRISSTRTRARVRTARVRTARRHSARTRTAYAPERVAGAVREVPAEVIAEVPATPG